MSINYAVLKSSIIFSSIWMEDSDTRIVWVTLIAMRNKDGEIYSSMVGLAHAARVDLEKTKAAVEKFLQPDTESTTKEQEGRRLEAIAGGWRLINHEKIKAEAKAAGHAAYMAEYMRDRRRKGNRMLKQSGYGKPLKGELRAIEAEADGKPELAEAIAAGEA